jgi:hypothetical protein
MSETNPDPAEPTENLPGGSAPQPAQDPEEAAQAEPTEDLPGGVS